MDKKEKCHEIMFFILHQLSVTEISLLRIINILFFIRMVFLFDKKKTIDKNNMEKNVFWSMFR